MRTSRSPGGKRVVDFQKCNLHVLNYSTPVRATMPLSELRPHLFTIPDIPTGFLTERLTTRKTGDFVSRITRCWRMEDGEYEVCIDSTLEGWTPDLRRMLSSRAID